MRRVVRDAYLVTREGERGILMRKAMGRMSCVAMVLMLLLQATVGWAADPTSNDPRTMRFPTVEFSPPDAERVVLENGMWSICSKITNSRW